MSERSIRIRLDVAYDGTGRAGWAVQPGLPTVQGTLEDALARVLRVPVSLTCAGRTDAGVHARGQVAHADVPADIWAALPGRGSRSPAESLSRRLAALLPREVQVRAVSEAPAGFDARFSATWRAYRYRIADTLAVRDPLRADVLWWRRPLDAAAMDEASAPLAGFHDFAAYAKPRPGATTLRHLHVYRWRREDGLLVADVRADAFCHSMVRFLVGAAVAVGEGRRPVDFPARVLAGARRDPLVQVMPPVGLTLEEVGYPPDAELAERARAARRRRDETAPRGPGTDPGDGAVVFGA